jgi:predicted MFS family arabinose efflux permease
MTITGASLLPVSLLGALVVQMRADIAITTFQLGAAIAIFGIVTSLLSVPAGRLVDRLDWMRSVWLSGVLLALPLLAIATVAREFWQVAVLVGIAGLGNAVAQPAANLAILRGVRRARHGFAFGAKQAAVPAGSLLAGLAVPLIALTIGWQWAFGIAGIGILALCTASPVSDRNPIALRSSQVHIRGVLRDPALLLLALGNLTSAMGVNAIFAFLVDASVVRGIDPAAAGLLLAFGGAIGTISRLVVGWYADAHPMSTASMLRAMSVMAMLGAPGLLILGAFGASVVSVAVGLLFAIGSGFAWSGIFNLVVTRTWHASPAAATGVTQSGLWVGGTFGPLLFGFLAGWSYALAFFVGAGFVFCAAASLAGARRILLHRLAV